MPAPKAHFLVSAANRSGWPDHDLEEIVVVGRSNVGKSSFINALLNQKSLAYVGKTPGKTQLLNFFQVKDQFVLVDVPGYGYAKLSKKQLEQIGEMMEDYFAHRGKINTVVSLIDSRQGPTADDIDMMEYLQAKGLEIYPVITKIDKIPKTKRQAAINRVAKALGIEARDLGVVSSTEKTGFDKVYAELLERLKDEQEKKVHGV